MSTFFSPRANREYQSRLPHERVLEKVAPVGDCWIYTGSVKPNGYGQVGVGSKADGTKTVRYAHRVVYEALVGPIPVGLELDHLCRTRACVNPTHLEPVTPTENLRRGMGPAAVNARKTHCARGHDLPPYQRGKKRFCAPCQQERRAGL
jgi:hypothetical protein